MEHTKANSQVTHDLRDSLGDPLISGRRYMLTAPGCKPVQVMLSEDELNFDLWFRPVGDPLARPQRVDELAWDVELVLFD